MQDDKVLIASVDFIVDKRMRVRFMRFVRFVRFVRFAHLFHTRFPCVHNN